MQAVASVVLPVFAIILCGYVAGQLRLLGSQSSDALNAFVYWVALPALFLRGLDHAPLASILDWDLIAAYLGATFLVFLLALAVARLLFRLPPDASALHAL